MTRLPPPPPGWSRSPHYRTRYRYPDDEGEGYRDGWVYHRSVRDIERAAFPYGAPEGWYPGRELAAHVLHTVYLQPRGFPRGAGRQTPSHFVAGMAAGTVRETFTSRDAAYAGHPLDFPAFVAYAERGYVALWHRAMTDPELRVETWTGLPRPPVGWVHTETGLDSTRERMNAGGSAVLTSGPDGRRSAVHVEWQCSSGAAPGVREFLGPPWNPPEGTDEEGVAGVYALVGYEGLLDVLGLIRERP